MLGHNHYSDLHVAIIMDGNGRWAKKHLLPTLEGHRRGAKNLKHVCEYAYDMGIKYLTVYAFSTENWHRPKKEVNDLMNLLRHYLQNEIETLCNMNIKLGVIGDLEMLAPDINQMIQEAINKSADNNGLFLNIALSYGARREIVSATRQIADKLAEGRIQYSEINEKLLESHLYTNNLPDVDILIRTGGEYRISNFMLWQISYAELFFLDVLWPDFSKQDMKNVLNAYRDRERRYGKRSIAS